MEGATENMKKEKGSDKSSLDPLCWPTRRAAESVKNDAFEGKRKLNANVDDGVDSCNSKNQRSKLSELELMKERFAKLLLGEDMSGSGKGVSPALAISNAITNLCATVFGQLSRLEPLQSEKKAMWEREIEWLVCVGEHIVELTPSCQTFPDGTMVEVMTCRPRSDIFLNLPALRKLDNMLLEILDGFTSTEFWYVDKGRIAPEANGAVSFQKAIRQEDKWWLPVPRVPHGGLPEDTRKQLNHRRESASQIHKAAMAINSIALAEMEVPESYSESLPKNGRACLGDVMYRCITSEHFSAECLLDCLDLSTEHAALDIANRVEAAIDLWKKQATNHRSTAKSSWEIVKGIVIDGGDKRDLLAERAESLLLCLRQRFPCLAQTDLDVSKIQCNKDVGKSILESYSRVIESLAFNIVARIDDLLYVDDISKHSDKTSTIGHRKAIVPYSVPISSTPYRTAFTTPNFSPARLSGSPARSPHLGGYGSKPSPLRGLGVRRVLTNYLEGEVKV